MPDITNNDKSAFVPDDDIVGKGIKVEPKPEKQIGIDTNNSFYQNIIATGLSDKLDMSALDSFLTTTRSRDQLYSLIDDMGEDPIIAAALESYAEDATNTNDNGDIVWAESADGDISKYVNYLLKAMRVNKNIYGWVHSLCKYGDIYLRLYRKSDYDNDQLLDDKLSQERKLLNEDIHLSDPDLDPDLSKEQLTEAVKIKAYSKDDHYVHYIEMVPNPAEMFELTKFGKSYAYIKSEVNSPLVGSRDWFQGSEFMRYRFNRNDIKVYPATEFVHGYLEDSQDRVPEEVSIEFNNGSEDEKEVATSTYRVRRGQSMLYTVFKIWRMLQLLENSILLNRVTKSAIVRILGIEVGDMPKEDIAGHLQGIKSLIEQKSSLEASKHMNEYTNPGPIGNNIYIPKHNGVGAIDMQTIGGDVNVGELTDLDYFRRKMFAALRIPGQYLNFTDDNAGFSGGQSLAIISARYAKMVIRVQNTMVQTITDAVNLMLLDKGLSGYVNKFTIKMQKPITQDDIDRKDAMSGNLQTTGDIMNLLSDLIEDPEKKLCIVKELLTPYLANPEVIDIIQQEIDRLEEEKTKEEEEQAAEQPQEATTGGEEETEKEPQAGGGMSLAQELGLETPAEETGGGEETTEPETSEEEPVRDENALPSPAELGIDFTNSDQPDFE